MSETLGFVGLGAMGGPMVKRLVDHGYRVVVFDLDKAAVQRAVASGAEAADSVKAAASAGEIVLVSLPTPDVVRAVALGADGVSAGTAKIFVDLSTTGPRAAGEIGKGLIAAGIVPVDAPVSGGIAGAVKGTLAVMVSCPKATFDRIEPIVTIIGKSTFHVGEEPGQGQMMKLINNFLSGTAMAASAEAFVLGVKAGLDPDIMVDVINAGSGANTAVRDKFPKAVLTRTFDFGFRTELMTKDVKLCMDEAEALGVPMWVGQSVKQWWTYALARGGKTEDFTAIVKYVEEPVGVTVRGKRNDR